MDRKKINRMTRWAALILAVVFGLGTVLLGVGSKTGNIFSGCYSNSKGSISASSSVAEKEAYYQDLVAQNPQDKDSMLALVTLYSDTSVGRYNDAITWLNKYLTLDPTNMDQRLRIARIQMDNLQDSAAAVQTLIQVTTTDPTNAAAFLMLGQAAKGAGQNSTAILAWNRYLELAPTSEYASLIKDEIAKLVAAPAAAPTATTVVPGTSGTSSPAAPVSTTPGP
ncbi:MAG: tetratricopeptide repeat protein [Thermoleophilia bacterium]